MITSIHNQKVQLVRKLQSQAKARHDQQAFVVEGVRLVEEALHSGWQALHVLYSGSLDERGTHLVDGFSSLGVPVEQVSDAVMQSISETETPQGVLAVIRQQAIPLPSIPGFILILDGLRDPGNLGTVLRTAAAAGVQAVLLTSGSVDAFAPKVLRGGMGAHFRLPIHTLGWPEIGKLVKNPAHRLKTYLADAAAGISYTQADFRSPLALIIGGEAFGAGMEASSLADEKVHIPMPGGSESLNAGVAAGILLFEVVRQRTS